MLKRHKPHREDTTVTPDIALAWLTANVANRNLSKATVVKYANDMANGAWELTGDPIRFDIDGNLIDGQHRLHACILADTPFETSVIYGLDPHIQDVIDGGRARRAGDVLSIRGFTKSKAVAAVATLIVTEGSNTSRSKGSISTSDVLCVLDEHPKLTHYVLAGKALPRGIPPSFVSYIYYVGSVPLKQQDIAAAYVETMKNGTPSYKNDPVHKLRERLLRMRSDNVHHQNRYYLLQAFKHAWNLRVEERPVTTFVFPQREVSIKGLKARQLIKKTRANTSELRIAKIEPVTEAAE